MIISLGQDVVGTDGKLGVIDGFSIDPNSQAADQIVIKHGLLGSDRRLAVLGHVTGLDSGAVQVDLNGKDIETLELYDPDAYSGADLGAPSHLPFQQEGDQRFNFGMHQTPGTVAPSVNTDAPLNDAHRMTPPYPTGNDVAPDDKRLIVVSEGMDVLDNTGERVAQVHGLAVETSTGEPAHISVKRGGLLSSARFDLPLDWVEQFTFRNVVLNVDKGQLEDLFKS